MLQSEGAERFPNECESLVGALLKQLLVGGSGVLSRPDPFVLPRKSSKLRSGVISHPENIRSSTQTFEEAIVEDRRLKKDVGAWQEEHRLIGFLLLSPKAMRGWFILITRNRKHLHLVHTIRFLSCLCSPSSAPYPCGLRS